MEAIIYITGIIGEDVTLLDCIRQFKSYENPTSVKAIIDSEGGNINEGDQIYNYLVGLKSTHEVSTFAKKAYSISAKIFCAGDIREVEAGENKVMLHLPWIENLSGGADLFEMAASSLRDIENDFYDFYSEFLNIDLETTKGLLSKDRYFSSEAAVDVNLASSEKAQLKAVAKYSNPNNKIEMTKQKKKNILEKIVALFDFKGELILQDVNSVEIVFPDLEENDTPKVGDKATVEGKAIEDETYTMPSMGESKVTFKNGAIESIEPKEEAISEPATDMVDDAVAKKIKEIETLNAEIETLKKAKSEEVREVWSSSQTVVSTSFNIGDTVELEGWEDDTYTASAGEFIREDGSKIVTDASGVIVAIKPADTPIADPVPTNEEISTIQANAKLELETAKGLAVKEKETLELDFKAKLEAKEVEIIELKRKITSVELKASAREDRQINSKIAKKGKERAIEIMNAKNG